MNFSLEKTARFLKTISQSLYTVESWAAKPTEKKQIVAGQEVTKTTLLDLSDKSFFFPRLAVQKPSGEGSWPNIQ